MPRITFTLCLLLIAASLSAQTTPTLQTGNFAGPFSISLSSSTSYGDLAKPKWDIIFQSLPNEADENLFHLKELKAWTLLIHRQHASVSQWKRVMVRAFVFAFLSFLSFSS